LTEWSAQEAGFLDRPDCETKSSTLPEPSLRGGKAYDLAFSGIQAQANIRSSGLDATDMIDQVMNRIAKSDVIQIP
jgi:hypothetical protein